MESNVVSSYINVWHILSMVKYPNIRVAVPQIPH